LVWQRLKGHTASIFRVKVNKQESTRSKETNKMQMASKEKIEPIAFFQNMGGLLLNLFTFQYSVALQYSSRSFMCESKID
jgi:hypothetical protein